jgi:hypothetical protein
MTNKLNTMPSLAAGHPGRLPPVRVKLLRPDAYESQTYLPSGRRYRLATWTNIWFIRYFFVLLVGAIGRHWLRQPVVQLGDPLLSGIRSC